MGCECERHKSNKGKVTVVLDAQAGSCGKGKFIGYLARKDNIDIAINNFMSNAGHTFVYNDGRRVMTQHLPTGIVNRNTNLLIGPGAAITPEILINEIAGYKSIIGSREIVIHPRAALILEKHREIERETIRSGSTFKGCGAAQACKIMRGDDVVLAGSEKGKRILISWIQNIANNDQMVDYLLDRIKISDTGRIINTCIDRGSSILVEGSQGFDLDINYGLGYPHTTSRQCHAGQLLADCGISPRLVDDIIMIMRPYPIRISNTTEFGEISSGDYDGSEEITWDEVKRRCGAPGSVQFGEITTVTKKMRRVFELNMDRLKYAVQINRPTGIAINFMQYVDWDVYECKSWEGLSVKAKNFVKYIETNTGVPVVLIGTGPTDGDTIDRRPYSEFKIDMKIGE